MRCSICDDWIKDGGMSINRRICTECFQEIKHDIIPSANAITGPSKTTPGGTSRQLDPDPSPSGENAIKYMEDG